MEEQRPDTDGRDANPCFVFDIGSAARQQLDVPAMFEDAHCRAHR
jgi:hypothetical protein